MAGATGRLILAGLAATLVVAAGPAAPTPVRMLAGRYSHHFLNGLVDGSSFWSDDVVEIVPVDGSHAFVRAETNFFNGHMCSIFGIAVAAGDALVYRDSSPGADFHSRCVLSIRRRGASLSLDDGDGGCRDYCGARGSFSDERLPWASRRPIHYLARLKRSSQYRDAVTEWKTGKPVR